MPRAGPHLLGLQGEGKNPGLARISRMGQASCRPYPSRFILAAILPVHPESPTHRCQAMPGNVPSHRETTTTHSFPQHLDTEPWAKVLRPPRTEVPPRGPLGVQIHRLHPDSSSPSPDLGMCMFNKHCRAGPSQGVGGLEYEARETS